MPKHPRLRKRFIVLLILITVGIAISITYLVLPINYVSQLDVTMPMGGRDSTSQHWQIELGTGIRVKASLAITSTGTVGFGSLGFGLKDILGNFNTLIGGPVKVNQYAIWTGITNADGTYLLAVDDNSNVSMIVHVTFSTD